jgi:hypothetical protein
MAFSAGRGRLKFFLAADAFSGSKSEFLPVLSVAFQAVCLVEIHAELPGSLVLVNNRPIVYNGRQGEIALRPRLLYQTRPEEQLRSSVNFSNGSEERTFPGSARLAR